MKGSIRVEGHTFKSENELKRYFGLKELVRSGRLNSLEVYPTINLCLNDSFICDYKPTFRFYDNDVKKERVVHVFSSPATPLIEIKIRLMLVLYGVDVEYWGD